MAANSQRKGRRGEIELANILRSFGYDVLPAQALNYGKIPDLIGLPGVHIECKRGERLNISDAMSQAIRDAKKFNDGIPAVFHRKNRESWQVTMKLDDFMKIYKKANGEKNDECTETCN